MAKRRRASDALIVWLVIAVVGIALILAYWQAAIVVALAVGALWFWMHSREPSTSSPPLPSRSRREQPPGTIWPAGVHVATLDPTWPSVPQISEHVRRTTDERNAPPFATTLCPSCGVAISPLPKTRKRCRSCGADMLVRVGTDGQRHLLSTAQAATFDEYESQRDAKRFDDERRAWYAELRMRGVLLAANPEDGLGLEVVGESHYQTDLAGLMAALRTDPGQREVAVIARLRREPSNRYDRNAIRVDVHGHVVGYLSRNDAVELQPWVRGVEGKGRPVFLLATIGGGYVRDNGRLSPIGVTLDELPEEAWR